VHLDGSAGEVLNEVDLISIADIAYR
jgi:hypothetical protein